jgi:hypothetical protein
MPGKSKTSVVKPTGKYTLGQKAAEEGFDITLPSGETCRARRPGVQGLIAMGLLDSFDSLTSLVQTEHIEAKTARGKTPAKVDADQVQDMAAILMGDKDKLAKLLHMLDRVVAGIVIQPPVWIDYQIDKEPDSEWEKRQVQAEESGAVAVRAVDLDDKLFLIQWAVGGSSDLAAFRQGSQELMGNLAGGEAV